MIRKAPNLTCWTILIAYLLQVLVVAQGGVLCFGSMSPNAGHDHPQSVSVAHCHSHDIDGSSHDHHHSHNVTEDAGPVGIEPDHCPCAHMHVSIEVGRTSDRVQLAHVKFAAAVHPVPPPQSPPPPLAGGLAHRAVHDPPAIKQTVQIIRSTVLLI